MWLSKLVIWFTFASMAGWLFESAYSVVKTGHWEKRGFLFGPVCPIYGAGVIAALVLFDRPEVANGTFPIGPVFLSCMVGSTIMEYTVSVTLEKLFGAVWWDYTNMPLNLNGRICLPASLLFGAAGTAVVYLALPIIRIVNSIIPPVIFEAGALLAVFAFGLDLATTVISLTDLMKKITHLSDKANTHADARVQQAGDSIRALPYLARKGSKKMRATLSGSQEKLHHVTYGLTKRQVRLLAQFKRFASRSTYENAKLLQNTIRESDRKDEAE